MIGDYDGNRLSVEVVHRFQNRPVQAANGLHWNIRKLFEEVLAGLGNAGGIASIGVDAWGCDYALLDEDGQMFGDPFHHRDPRTESIPERAFAVVSRDELYARTGVQHLRFNTVFQLLADAEAGLPLERAARIALIPDLVNYWLTGEMVNEETAASTTGLTNALSREWDQMLVERFCLPAAPFHHDLVQPGMIVGQLDSRFGMDDGPLVRTVGAHDTASAFAATPVSSSRAGFISCGTWSLVGLELSHPCLDGNAAAANLSNEWGVDGTTRLLKNVMGLWLLQECKRQWELVGANPGGYDELQALAAAASGPVPVFDPNLDLFLTPGDMPARIAAICQQTGQEPPAGPGELTRSILLSLACAYRRVFDELAVITGRGLDTVHLVGGGALNKVLCQLTANIVGVKVVAGPIEAAAIGNILVQMQAAGAFGSREEMRSCVMRSFSPLVYEPGDTDSDYERFLSVSGSREHTHVGAPS